MSVRSRPAGEISARRPLQYHRRFDVTPEWLLTGYEPERGERADGSSTAAPNKAMATAPNLTRGLMMSFLEFGSHLEISGVFHGSKEIG